MTRSELVPEQRPESRAQRNADFDQAQHEYLRLLAKLNASATMQELFGWVVEFHDAIEIRAARDKPQFPLSESGLRDLQTFWTASLKLGVLLEMLHNEPLPIVDISRLVGLPLADTTTVLYYLYRFGAVQRTRFKRSFTAILASEQIVPGEVAKA
jgi:hypothetical protein